MTKQKNNKNGIMLLEIDGSSGIHSVKKELIDSWGEFLIYHIHNVPETDYVTLYENLADELGVIEECRPVNDKTKTISKSRDIKPNPDLYHFYAANTRQPLHTDYAYFPIDKSPDWVLMYCLKPSQLGGTTRFLSSKSLIEIMNRYDPDLLDKLSVDVTWKYVGEDGDVIHKKPIMEGENINWNYWQIKSDLNDKLIMDIRESFFKFLENAIVDGSIYDFSKVWTRGDLIIWNDKKILHGRDSFLGDRWLKDHALFDNK